MTLDLNMPDTALSALLASGDVAYSWDIDSDSMTFYGDVESLFGVGVTVADGISYHERLSAEDLPKRTILVSGSGMESRAVDLEYRLRRTDGAFCWVHERGRLDYAEDGIPARLAGTLRIVTDRMADVEDVRDRALYDTLTGFHNSTRLREAIDLSLSHARRYAQQGAYLVIGVDDFDRISEAHGSKVADQVIVGIGRRLEDGVRATDIIGRIGEGLFGVVLSRCPETGVIVAARNIIDQIASKPVQASDTVVPVTVSIGGVSFPNIAKTPTAAMIDAESAYRQAAGQGGGNVSIHRLTTRQEAREKAHMILAAVLLEAVRENRITLAYQPVVRSLDSSVAYHETLLRIAGEEGGPFEAAVFVPVAEQLGHSRRIDRQVLELAAADLLRHRDISLAINISGHTVTDRSWLRVLSSFVKERPEMAKRLTVEITETAEIHDFEEASRFVSAVRKLGCRVALDDFGAGYTSFRHLKSLPVDIVKIDGSFIRGIAENRENQEFLDTLLTLTRSFGIETVAECVETIADRDYLLERGVNYFQGWMFGRPAFDSLAAGSKIRPPAA